MPKLGYLIGVKGDHAVHLMKPVAVRSVPAYGTHGKPNLYHYCNYSYHHHGYRLLIIIFAIFVCVCVGCCRKCYCKPDRSREITITAESNARAVEYIEQSSSSYNKRHIDAPPSYFDITPNFKQDDDLPPPYPGENNT